MKGHARKMSGLNQTSGPPHWGYVSAKVIGLDAGQTMILPSDGARLVLVSGIVRMAAAGLAPLELMAQPDGSDSASLDIPAGGGSLTAQTAARVVLYSQARP